MHKQAARTFLNWFETNAPEGAELIYAPGTDFVERYRTPDEGIKNAIDFVSVLAYQRLTIEDAKAVIEIAKGMLRPNG